MQCVKAIITSFGSRKSQCRKIQVHENVQMEHYPEEKFHNEEEKGKVGVPLGRSFDDREAHVTIAAGATNHPDPTVAANRT